MQLTADQYEFLDRTKLEPSYSPHYEYHNLNQACTITDVIAPFVDEENKGNVTYNTAPICF